MLWYIRRKSYEVLPALSVRGAELRRSMRRIVIAISFCWLWIVMVRGAHTVAFCRMLGFNDLAFGFWSAAPFLAMFLQPITSIMIERTGLRKYQFIIFATIHRLMWIAVAAVPLFLPIPSQLAVWAVLFIVAISSVLASFSNPAWWPWMGDLIPKRIRGRFIATQARIGKFVAIIAVLILGVVLDVRPRAHQNTKAMMT